MTISSNATGLKKCAECKVDKLLSDYTIRKNGKVASYCKSCTAQKSADYRANNREKYLESKRQARKRFKDTKSSTAIRKMWDNLNFHEQREAQCGIYCITINDKFYIGSCISFKNRMDEHTRKLRSRKSCK